MDKLYLYGLDDCYIDHHTTKFPIHRQALAAFASLQQRAASAGFELQVASAYRSFERQLLIWNGKAEGSGRFWMRLDKYLICRSWILGSRCKRFYAGRLCRERPDIIGERMWMCMMRLR
ncbi:D-alanyl-D-alanine carboxypeptidase family protein [Oceanicoccus sp. KOV_DT_Chl]|uniref:D-alanyl-D-alanine carboxypeptidase family protein n=1 Tax=Oceanicoccus sp. KOV_DT_Chl TaxID=1904639 RepID=UPI002100730C|nr:D-alanyl-D-alanine carboxypeptidase family protein [Oceanicoccus sp. KOV_DT_Chl]